MRYVVDKVAESLNNSVVVRRNETLAVLEKVINIMSPHLGKGNLAILIVYSLSSSSTVTVVGSLTLCACSV